MQPWIQRWEYRGVIQDYDKKKRTGSVTIDPTKSFSGNLIDALNILGQEGWELAGFTTIEFPDGYLFQYILKRPVQG